MTVELLKILSIVAYIVAGVLFLSAVAMFFLLDVPKLYGDVSGRTAKKAIEAISKQNKSTQNKAYTPRTVNAERGRLTDKITPSGRLQLQNDGLYVDVATEKFNTSTLSPQTNETTILKQVADETTVLTNDLLQENGETTVLELKSNIVQQSQEVSFSTDVEISFYSTSEIIE